MKLDPEERPIARCFLHNRENPKNACYLTDKRLVIVQRGINTEFYNDHLEYIRLSRRVLLIPFTTGGIISSLSVVALFNLSDYNPYLLLLILFAGIGLIYWGAVGSPALTVMYHGREQNILLNRLSLPIREFIRFTNQYLQKQPLQEWRTRFFKWITKAEWLKLKDQEMVKFSEHFLTYDQMKKDLTTHVKNNDILVTVDPVSFNFEANFITVDDTEELFPSIKGPVPVDKLMLPDPELFT